MLFSQRMGLKPTNKLSQRESIDEELRNKIWNVLKLNLWDQWEPIPNVYSTRSRNQAAKEIDQLMNVIWFKYFRKALDQMPAFDPKGNNSGYRVLREWVMQSQWNEVFDLIEFIVLHVPDRWCKGLVDFFNHVLTEENSAYRFIDRRIAEITDQTEIDAVEEAAISNTKSISSHLKRALELLSDRKRPDYRNSIKESISAVEAACQEITGKPGATLTQCLGAIKAKRNLHPAFEQSLIKLYGFTSDSGGIRHAMTDDAEKPTYADAKFMLVSCSGLTNYFRTLLSE